MWKKGGKRPHQESQSLVKHQTSKSYSQLKSNSESMLNSSILAEESKREQQKSYQKLARSRSQLQIPMLNTIKELEKPEDQGWPNKLKFNSETKLPQKQQTQSDIGHTLENPIFVKNLKQKIRSVFDAVHQVKLQHQHMKNDYRQQAKEFQQLMHKFTHSTAQKTTQNVNSALMQIKNYREKLSQFDMRKEKILKDYGLNFNQLI